ncbi:hypothetical protein C3V38_00135 [Dietzia sp. oral taxon 368]|nr:hypothetical protein C3V38_00135 [Dietzia sp. oral taxon 368]
MPPRRATPPAGPAAEPSSTELVSLFRIAMVVWVAPRACAGTATTTRPALVANGTARSGDGRAETYLCR